MTLFIITALAVLVCFAAQLGWPGVGLWAAMLPFVLMTLAPVILKENDHEFHPATLDMDKAD